MSSAPPAPSNQQTEIEWASDAQEWFVTAGPQPTLLLGGVNSAKTFGACLKILYLASRYPRSHIAVVRKTYKHLTATTMQTFYAMLDPKHYRPFGTRNDAAGYLRLNNGTEIFFIHLDAPNSLTLLQGLELNFAFVDQAEEISVQAWETLETRVGRWRYAEVSDEVIQEHERATGNDWPWRAKDGHPLPPPYLFATANPPGDELHWLFEHFSEDSEEWQTKWKGLGYQYKITDTRENKFASQANIDTLLARDEQWVERFVKGKWGRPEGCIFRVHPDSLLDYDSQLVAKIRGTMRLGRALDHGDSSPTCCLYFGTDSDGRVFVWAEYYQPGIGKDGKEYGIREHRSTISKISERTRFSLNVADPQIFYKSRNISAYATKAERWSIAEEYADRALMPSDTALHWTEGDNNEDVSRFRIREYLKIDPGLKHPITGELGAPRLYFIMRSDEYAIGCDKVVAELKQAKRVQIGESNGRPIYSDERDPSIPDHALDSLRYYLNAHPMPASLPAPDREIRMNAIGQGAVTVFLPPIRSVSSVRDRVTKTWKSRAGGY